MVSIKNFKSTIIPAIIGGAVVAAVDAIASWLIAKKLAKDIDLYDDDDLDLDFDSIDDRVSDDGPDDPIAAVMPSKDPNPELDVRALNGIRSDAYNSGFAKGLEAGRNEGYQSGYSDGYTQGQTAGREAAREDIDEAYANGKLDVLDAYEMPVLSDEEDVEPDETDDSADNDTDGAPDSNDPDASEPGEDPAVVTLDNEDECHKLVEEFIEATKTKQNDDLTQAYVSCVIRAILYAKELPNDEFKGRDALQAVSDFLNTIKNVKQLKAVINASGNKNAKCELASFLLASQNAHEQMLATAAAQLAVYLTHSHTEA